MCQKHIDASLFTLMTEACCAFMLVTTCTSPWLSTLVPVHRAGIGAALQDLWCAWCIIFSRQLTVFSSTWMTCYFGWTLVRPRSGHPWSRWSSFAWASLWVGRKPRWATRSRGLAGLSPHACGQSRFHPAKWLGSLIKWPKLCGCPNFLYVICSPLLANSFG